MAKQALRQGLRWLLITAGPAGVLAGLALLAVIGLYYGLPAAAHTKSADPLFSEPHALWRQSEAAAAAAMPPVRSLDGSERNWPVDPGWLAALAAAAAASGRPVDLGAWAAALAPRFSYMASTITTTKLPPRATGLPAPPALTTVQAVLLLARADTALGTAARSYSWVRQVSTAPDGSIVTVRRQVPVATSWTPDTARLAALVRRVLGGRVGAAGLQAFFALAAAWDDPGSGLAALLGPAAAAPPPTSPAVVRNVLRWQALIVAAARAAGIDPALVDAVVAAESGGDPHAVSPAGAEGLMQVEPATAAALGIADLFDPAGNLRAGTEHLAWLLHEYGFGAGCWPRPGQSVAAQCLMPLRKAIAAYNAGEGALAQYGGVPPYPETQGYLRTVLGYYGAFRRAGSVVP